MTQLSTLERAFQLAGGPSCRSVSDIKRQLQKENYEAVEAHLAGTGIKQQLASRLATRLS